MAIKFSRSDEKYGKFSNFLNVSITYDGLTYKSSEAAWQAQKTLDLQERRRFIEVGPGESKKMGRSCTLRPDWEEVKYGLMVEVLTAKFTQHKELKDLLLSTGDEEIIENTTGWHDNIWGNCDCDKCKNIKGQNLLGKALMEVRSNLR